MLRAPSSSSGPTTASASSPAACPCPETPAPTGEPGRTPHREPHGPGSNLADSTLLELTANGELILVGGTGNGYRLADVGPANSPSGWLREPKVRMPAGATLRCVLRYSSP